MEMSNIETIYLNDYELKKKRAREIYEYLRTCKLHLLEEYDPYKDEAKRHAEDILIDSERDFADWNTYKLKHDNHQK